MDRILSFIISAILFICSTLGIVPTKIQDDIIIIFTNDVHCAADTNIGYAGVAAYKKECCQESDYVALVDCGDYTQGNFLSTISKGKSMIDIMNYIGYDFATIGNHEFDYGMDTLKENIEYLNAKTLCCNIKYSGKGENKLDDVKPYEIVRYGSIKVAYIGVTTPYTPANTSPYTFMEDGEIVYTFTIGNDGERLCNCIQNNVNDARSKGADYVILLSHLGDQIDCEPYSSLDIISNTYGIDAVFDGHTHTVVDGKTVLNKNGEEVILSQTGTQLSNIGKLVIEADGDITSELISNYDKKDPETEKMVNETIDLYSDDLNRVIATIDFDLPIADEDGIRMVRTREMAIGDLVADAFRSSSGSDIAMENAGGIRASIKAGNIKYADTLSVNAFGNTLCVMNLTGSEILDILEFSYHLVQSDYKKDGAPLGEHGSFMQLSGITCTVDTSIPTPVVKNEDGDLLYIEGERRVSDVKVLKNGEYVPIDPQATYSVTSTNYMLKNGGCGMLYYLAGKSVTMDEYIIDCQALANYIEDPDVNLSQYSTVGNRITLK